MCLSNRLANGRQFLRNLPRPLRMIGGLPRKIEYAVAVLCDAPVAVDLHADCDKRVLRRIEPFEALPLYARVDTPQLLQQALLQQAFGNSR